MRDIIAKAARARAFMHFMGDYLAQFFRRLDTTDPGLPQIHPIQRAATSRSVMHGVTRRKEKRPLGPLLTDASLSRARVRKQSHLFNQSRHLESVHQIARIPEYHSAGSGRATLTGSKIHPNFSSTVHRENDLPLSAQMSSLM